MYTEKQVDDMLSQVEQEFEKALSSITKNEKIEAKAEVQTEPEAQTEEDYETVDELYASMDKSEKEAHYNSIKKALFGEVKEKEEVKEVEAKETPMSKSESEVALEKDNEKLKKNLDTMNELLGKLFKDKAPKGKAITSNDYIAKSEETKEVGEELASLSKSEITEKLKGINYSGLSKSDRTAINEFCLNNGSKESIKHLITK